MRKIWDRIKSALNPEVDISFIKERAIESGYAKFRGDHQEIAEYLRERIRRKISRAPWANKVKNVNLIMSGTPDANTVEIDYKFYHITTPDICFIINSLNITSNFISKLAEIYSVWPELAEEILESYLVYAEGHITNYQMVVKGELPIEELRKDTNEQLAFMYLIHQRGIQSAVLCTYWFQAYIAEDYEAEEHTTGYFNTFRHPFIALTSDALKLTLQIEIEYQKRKEI